MCLIYQNLIIMNKLNLLHALKQLPDSKCGKLVAKLIGKIYQQSIFQSRYALPFQFGKGDSQEQSTQDNTLKRKLTINLKDCKIKEVTLLIIDDTVTLDVNHYAPLHLENHFHSERKYKLTYLENCLKGNCLLHAYRPHLCLPVISNVNFANHSLLKRFNCNLIQHTSRRTSITDTCEKEKDNKETDKQHNKLLKSFEFALTNSVNNQINHTKFMEENLNTWKKIVIYLSNVEGENSQYNNYTLMLKSKIIEMLDGLIKLNQDILASEYTDRTNMNNNLMDIKNHYSTNMKSLIKNKGDNQAKLFEKYKNLSNKLTHTICNKMHTCGQNYVKVINKQQNIENDLIRDDKKYDNEKEIRELLNDLKCMVDRNTNKKGKIKKSSKTDEEEDIYIGSEELKAIREHFILKRMKPLDLVNNEEMDKFQQKKNENNITNDSDKKDWNEFEKDDPVKQISEIIDQNIKKVVEKLTNFCHILTGENKSISNIQNTNNSIIENNNHHHENDLTKYEFSNRLKLKDMPDREFELYHPRLGKNTSDDTDNYLERKKNKIWHDSVFESKRNVENLEKETDTGKKKKVTEEDDYVEDEEEEEDISDKSMELAEKNKSKVLTLFCNRLTQLVKVMNELYNAKSMLRATVNTNKNVDLLKSEPINKIDPNKMPLNFDNPKSGLELYNTLLNSCDELNDKNLSNSLKSQLINGVEVNNEVLVLNLKIKLPLSCIRTMIAKNSLRLFTSPKLSAHHNDK